MVNLLEPKNIEIIDSSGAKRNFILSKFPAVQGREIVAKYPISNMPKLGDYAVSEETMLKLMGFVGVQTGEIVTTLNTMELVNNHARDWETLAKLEIAMMEYNCSFFQSGKILVSLREYAEKVLPKVFETLTGLLERSLVAVKQR